ncbi:NUDIX hydrolase [Candidatus Woesearchaeota archaeon]|jgi:ADP-ribose pyrophosphatase YjhB (NUDIX family)|nr:NUDIX hydrolase [Candidatus Woesearchaeota archaeon]MBT6519436.1 NUDIX hydrolase [Candidatus Woesearchaeota archaeon]MBT7368903.1 NUDIX hydrolase [Candidatus Woesearchaeota archaeon]
MDTIHSARCLISKGNTLLLVKKTKSSLFELPGKEFSSEDDPEVVAISAVEEQVSLTPRIIQQFGAFEIQEDGKNYNLAVFECSLDDPEQELKQGEGIEEIKWVPIKDLDKEKVWEDVLAVSEDL